MNNVDEVTVLHSCPIWLPQTQTWMHAQVTQLQRSGINAHVVCEETANLDTFGVANMHCLSDEPLCWQRWDNAIRRLRIRRHLGYQVRVGRLLRAQIVHSHFGHIGWTDIGVVQRLRARHVVTFYGLDVNMLPHQEPVWRKRYRRLFAEADVVLCEGTHMANCIIALGCHESKVKVQHLGIDLSRFNFKPRAWGRGDVLRVMLAASFREKKGIPLAIQALSLLHRKIPMEITIIGDAGAELESQKEKTRVMSVLHETGLVAKTRMLGYQPREVMIEEAYRHHVFLHPSITAANGDTEGGAPVCIIEMLATGMPVFSTLHCDIPEVMREMGEDFLVPEKRPDALAISLERALENWGVLTERVNAQRKYIESDYDIVKQNKRLVALYAALLK